MASNGVLDSYLYPTAWLAYNLKEIWYWAYLDVYIFWVKLYNYFPL